MSTSTTQVLRGFVCSEMVREQSYVQTKTIACKTPSVYVAENLVPDYSHSSLNLSRLCDFDGINFSLAFVT